MNDEHDNELKNNNNQEIQIDSLKNLGDQKNID